jgi:hypothetical protein
MKAQTQETRATDKLQTQPTSHAYVRTIIANFSHEEIDLPKATVLSLAEVTSEEVIAVINDDDSPDDKLRGKQNRIETNAKVDPAFQQYLTDRLSRLSGEERSVIEPVLITHRRVFQTNGSMDFPGTDLVEHRIETGDAKPIRPPYRCPMHLEKKWRMR